MTSPSRRGFLHRVAAGSLGIASFASCVGKPRVRTASSPALVGSQLYGWGQYYDREGKAAEAYLEDILRSLKDSGYDYAEGSLDVSRPDNNQRFADRLRSRGLQPVSLYTGGGFHGEQIAEATMQKIMSGAAACQKAGFSILVCNPDPIGREKTDAELLIQAATLKRLGTALADLGMQLGLHHHTPEMKSQAREFHSNFRHSSPGQVDFCFDVHWIYRGGMDPLKALELYQDRVVSWHLRQSRDHIWWEDLDSGDIDYPAIARVVAEKSIPRRYTVELALESGTRVTRSVHENHKRSRDYVRKVLAT